MQVIIVGAGIAGLTAAIGLRRAGHTVKLLERTPTATAFGAGVVIGPHASKVLESYGLDYSAAEINVAKERVIHNGVSLTRLRTSDMTRYDELSNGSKQYMAYRVNLQEALIGLATTIDAKGMPVEIIYNAHVSSYQPENGAITLNSGAILEADLVVAADGIYSVAPSCVLGHEVELSTTNTTVIRFMLPTERIISDPETRDLVGEGRISFYIGPSPNKFLTQYPVRNNTVQNFGMYVIGQDESWTDIQSSRFKCDRASLEKELNGFSPTLQKLASKASDILPIWKLADRDPLSTWHRGRLVVIGDAAHLMLPNQGQGAAMAIEDGGALGEIFSHMTSAGPADITRRLELFEKVRRGRATVTQLISRVPYFENAVEKMWDELLKYLPTDQLPPSNGSPATNIWLARYNVLQESRKALEQMESF